MPQAALTDGDGGVDLAGGATKTVRRGSNPVLTQAEIESIKQDKFFTEPPEKSEPKPTFCESVLRFVMCACLDRQALRE